MQAQESPSLLVPGSVGDVCPRALLGLFSLLPLSLWLSCARKLKEHSLVFSLARSGDTGRSHCIRDPHTHSQHQCCPPYQVAYYSESIQSKICQEERPWGGAQGSPLRVSGLTEALQRCTVTWPRVPTIPRLQAPRRKAGFSIKHMVQLSTGSHS